MGFKASDQLRSVDFEFVMYHLIILKGSLVKSSFTFFISAMSRFQLAELRFGNMSLISLGFDFSRALINPNI